MKFVPSTRIFQYCVGWSCGYHNKFSFQFGRQNQSQIIHFSSHVRHQLEQKKQVEWYQQKKQLKYQGSGNASIIRRFLQKRRSSMSFKSVVGLSYQMTSHSLLEKFRKISSNNETKNEAHYTGIFSLFPGTSSSLRSFGSTYGIGVFSLEFDFIIVKL